MNCQHSDIVELVEERVYKVKGPMNDIPNKLDDHERALKKSLASSKQFSDDADELLRWLTKMEQSVEELRPVSADKDFAVRQLHDHKYIDDDLQRHQKKFNDLFAGGEDLLKSAEPGAERDNLEEKLSNIKQRWGDLKESCDSRGNLLEDVVQLSEKYEDAKSKLLPWIDNAEKTAEAFEVISVEPELLDRQIKDVKKLSDELKKRRPEFEEITACGEPLSERAQCDEEPVQEFVENVKTRFNDLEDNLLTSDRKAADMKEEIRKFHFTIVPVEELTQQAERVLEDEKAVGDNIKVAQQAEDELQKWLNELQAHKADVFKVDQAGEQLLAIEHKPENVTSVKQRTEGVTKNYDDLIDRVKEKLDETKKNKENLDSYYGILEEVGRRTQPLQYKTNRLSAVASTPEKVKEQLIEVEECQAQLQENFKLFAEAEMFANEVIEFNNNDDSVKASVDDRLHRAKEPLDEMANTLNNREGQLKEQLEECGALQEQIEDFNRRIASLDERVENQKHQPVSGNPGRVKVSLCDMDNIRKDVDDEKIMFKNIVASTEKMLQASKNLHEREELQQKLDELTAHWATLNQTVQEERLAEEEVLQKTTHLDELMTNLDSMLDAHEKKLRALEPVACDPESLKKQQSEANVSVFLLRFIFIENVMAST